MGTTNTTQSSTNYNPQSLAQYQQFWGLASPILNSLINNPYNNSTYNLNLAQSTQAAQKYGSQATHNVLSNLNTTGMGQSGGGVKAALMSQMGRYTSNLNYQGFISAANQAQSDRWNSLGMQAGRQPLVMGGTQTQTTSGLGTWLPQVASMALGAATSVAAGGAGGGIPFASQAGQQAFNNWSNNNYGGAPSMPGLPGAGTTPIAPTASFNPLSMTPQGGSGPLLGI